MVLDPPVSRPPSSSTLAPPVPASQCIPVTSSARHEPPSLRALIATTTTPSPTRVAAAADAIKRPATGPAEQIGAHRVPHFIPTTAASMQAPATAHQQRAPPPPPPPLAPPPPCVSLAMPATGSPATEGFLADLLAGRSPRGAPPALLGSSSGAHGGAGDARCETDATGVAGIFALQHQQPQHHQQQPHAHPQAPTTTIPPGLSVAPAHGDPPTQAALPPPPVPPFAITTGPTSSVQPLLTQLQRRFSDFGPYPREPATMLATMDAGSSPWNMPATSAGPATALVTSDPTTPLGFLVDQQATSLPPPPGLMGLAPTTAPGPDMAGGTHGSLLLPPLVTSSDVEQKQQQLAPLPAAGIQVADLVKAAARSCQDDPQLVLDAPLAPETTRWLCVAGLDRTISPQDLEVFKSFGDISHLVSRMLAPYGVVLLAFLDIRQAQAAARRLRSLASATAPEWRVQFITAVDFQESTGVSLTEQDISSELALSQLPANVDAAGLKNLGQLFGEVRSVQVEMAHAVVDYFDARKADAALQGLPGVIRSVYSVSIHAERVLPAGMHPAPPSTTATAPAPGKSRVDVLRTGDAGTAFDRTASQLLDQSLLQSIAREQNSHTPPPLAARNRIARAHGPGPQTGRTRAPVPGARPKASTVETLLESKTAAAAASTPTVTAATAPPPSMSALYSSPDASLLGDLLD
ncbi:hypothetical protein AMAG_05383 [Allomyces macrogynus ATCC 38327]|uniref:RRM domain-containing protein n=1 Tax=Allomyces macrogynus (strain ATCC 38327) TaxID=578462 RepID=A0A0L0SBY3_ALLM3|nr:hypothetical protein AMAG_05383 [Allomyces macrogynus ATCC 38327]|eukprot:KNE59934.1 hypothetical protein AMAG_05383 [Allomyces macrogynus ATCC 38327]